MESQKYAMIDYMSTSLFSNLAEYIQSYISRGMPCLFHEATGYYCPGCGGTRAMLALLQGHPLVSLSYHPIVLYGIVAGLYLLVLFIKFIFDKKKNPFKSFRFPDKILWIALLILGANFIYKNAILFLYNL